MKLSIRPEEDKGKVHKAIMEASMWFQLKYPYWAEILLLNNIIETDKIPTAGVNFTHNGMNFYYNPKFFDSLSQPEANFVVIHEILHELFDHFQRTGKFYDRHLANIAQDMIINDIILDNFIKHVPVRARQVAVPVFKEGENKGKKMGVFLPLEYDGEKIFEKLYDWLKDEKEKLPPPPPGNGQGPKPPPGDDKGEGEGEGDPGEEGEPGEDGEGEGEGTPGEPSDKDGKGGDGNGEPSDKVGEGNGDGKGEPSDKDGKGGGNPTDEPGKESIKDILERLDNEAKNGESLDSHIDDDVEAEVRKQIVLDAINRIKARGLGDGNFEAILNRLKKSRKDYLKEIKRHICFLKGKMKHNTWAAANRKGLPLKGFKKYKANINVILDTSGSMKGDMNRVLSCIFQDGIKVNLVQVDTVVQAVEDVKNKAQLLKLKLKGFGGTRLQPGIDHVAKELNQFPTVILTDGRTDHLDLSHLKGHVLILSTQGPCPIEKSNNKLRQIGPVEEN